MAASGIQVLCVDDDAVVCAALKDQLGANWTVRTASSAVEAMKWLASLLPDEVPPVIISDLEMPGISGTAFLAWLRDCHPNTQRVLLSGAGDVRAAAAAVNEGQVVRFVVKPWAPAALETAMESAWTRHRMLAAERELLQQTVNGTIQMLMDTMGLLAPALFKRSAELTALVRGVGEALGLEDRWRLESAASLAPVGCLALPAALVERKLSGAPVSPPEELLWEQHPHIGYRLISRVPRLEDVALLVRSQLWDGLELRMPASLLREAQVLQMAMEADRLRCAGVSHDDIVRSLRVSFPPGLVVALSSVTLKPITGRQATIAPPALREEMLTQHEVCSADGTVLVPSNAMLTAALIERVRSHADLHGLAGPISVLVPG
jgi:FixJ family two-component response regulator